MNVFDNFTFLLLMLKILVLEIVWIASDFVHGLLIKLHQVGYLMFVKVMEHKAEDHNEFHKNVLGNDLTVPDICEQLNHRAQLLDSLWFEIVSVFQNKPKQEVLVEVENIVNEVKFGDLVVERVDYDVAFPLHLELVSSNYILIGREIKGKRFNVLV
jgi:hypothetical protein